MKKILFFFLLCLCGTYSHGQPNAIDSLERLAREHPRDSIGMMALLNLTNEFLRKDFGKAKTTAHKTVRQATSLKSAYGMTAAYGYLIPLYQNSANQDSAMYYLNNMEKLALENPGQPKIMANFNQSAGLYFKNQGEYKKAITYQLKNLTLITDESENRAGLFLNIGNNYFYLSDYKNAAHYHLEALTLFEKLNVPRGESFCLHSLGNDFFAIEQFGEAKRYYQRALEMKERLGDTRGSITTRMSLGEVAVQVKEYETAEKQYTRALQTAYAMKINAEIFQGEYQIGLLYKNMGDNKKARSHIQNSLKVARHLGDSTAVAKIKSELLGLDIAEQKKKEIGSTLASGLTTLILNGDRRAEAIEYSRLSEYHALQKQYDKAFEYLKKHEALKDSIQGSEVMLQMKDLEKKYESEKREKVIALLKQDKALQALAFSKQNANITIIVIALIAVIVIGILLINRYRIIHRTVREVEMERMRNAIARDLHDDIGSTLSSINILSQLALHENKNEQATYFQRIHDHSSKIMESMSDIVWSINPNNDSFEQVLVKMKEFAGEILEPKNIAYTFEVEENIARTVLSSDIRKNVFLIFKEAINNAAKYSEGSQVTIRALTQHEKIMFTIQDNGKGFDASFVKSGNGLKNMEERTKNILGRFFRSSEPGNGTLIQFEVPIT